ncbi:hypothetical protein SUGI_1089860 [Cryptomeria japonica]|uniref:putative UPF0481 protein At3g02645 n=1 Tax=Cryptomeria japonica TaxID=3369 RepID=UPI0024148F35|nr:putative UPF0481 protein At3g02645 [Cryptomeria japonica]GLJ51229.1 hypothetical protein SUGI_1089860 [Cryptomeria japonica]
MSQGNIMFMEEERKWVIDMTERITDRSITDCKPGPGYSGVTVNRVPKFLLFLRKESYTPRIVNLGLYHHVIAQPESHMERLKAEAVEMMARRLPRQEEHLHLQQAIVSIVCDIKWCYEERFEYKDETVAMIFTLDGCFVLEILRALTDGSREKNQVHSQQHCHPFFKTNRIKSCQFDVLGDILMLENQIPIMVLIKLLEVEKGSEEEARKELLRLLCSGIIPVIHPFLPYQPDTPNLVEARLNRFEDLEKNKHILGLLQSIIVEDPIDLEEKPPCGHNGLHLAVEGLLLAIKRLLLVLKEYLQKLINQPEEINVMRHQTLMASSRDLHKAGIKFKHYDGVPTLKKMRFVKRIFESSTLRLPTIWITDNTEVILRNLMALEVCHGFTLISYYVYLLNSLVETEGDVVVLRKAQIIQSSMGTDKEVAHILNNLWKGINFNSADDPFMNLKVDINSWYKKQLHIKISDYKHRHPRFWRNVSIFWGLAVLVSAAIPTLVNVWEKIV